MQNKLASTERVRGLDERDNVCYWKYFEGSEGILFVIREF